MVEPAKIPTAPQETPPPAEPELAASAPEPEPLDPFDPERLRVTPEYLAQAGVVKLLVTVPVGRPHPQEYFRVHPDPALRTTLATLEWAEERQFYVLTREILPCLPGEYVNVALYTAINRQGSIRLIPVKLPGSDGRVFEAHRAMTEAVERAMTRWIRVKWNNSLKSYDVFQASLSIPEPEWPPDLSLRELLKVGFRDRLIDKTDHPLIGKLHGTV